MNYTKKIIGNYKNEDVYEIKISLDSSRYVSFWSLGARINEFYIEDIGNIILGYNSVDEFLANRSYFFGATVGRVGGRISNASFNIDGKSYKLDKNDGENHLHGGDRGFDLRNWDFGIEENKYSIKIIFSLEDKTVPNYYPGNMKVKVTHTVIKEGDWIIDYYATSDADTIFNPSNHVYFNLNANKNPITNHYLRVDSDFILETDEDLIPTGEKIDIGSSELDFSKDKNLGEVLNSQYPEIKKNSGLDTAFILNKEDEVSLNLRNDLLSLEVITDRDSLILYSLNKIDSNSSMDLVKNQGIAIEAQQLPDAINQRYFGSIILRKGEEFKSQSIYKVRKI